MININQQDNLLKIEKKICIDFTNSVAEIAKHFNKNFKIILCINKQIRKISIEVFTYDYKIMFSHFSTRFNFCELK